VASLHDRLAGGPISWGVCEVPGWGAELPPDRVLAEMRELGITATEAGPDGYLGRNAADVRALLERHGLRLLGGFLPLVLHERSAHDASLSSAERVATLFAETGATFVVTAVVGDLSWPPRFDLTDAQWRNVFDGLARVDDVAAAHGLTHVMHPHWGTLVERREDVWRVLERSDVLLCLDTGHLVLGETDPAELARAGGDRIAHVHLKDVEPGVARRLRDGELALVPAVQAGLFRPLGEGRAPVAETLRALDEHGYRGWYVLEQDCALSTADIPGGQGPIEDVRRSIAFLEALSGERVAEVEARRDTGWEPGQAGHPMQGERR
jgi:inosose dehydratase